MIDYSSAKRVIIELLKSAVVEEVISACLKSLKDPGWLCISLESILCTIAGLSVCRRRPRLAGLEPEDDKQRLIEMLSDKEWWVRYRAAKALEKMPFLSSEEVKSIQSDHPDRFFEGCT